MSNPRQVDYLIWEIWKYGNGCDEVVLLGDILDLWRAPPEKAVREARYFFKMLADLDVRVNYVIGNHDHHLTVLYKENQFLERVARGDVFPVYVPNLRWSQSIDGLNVNMYYPAYSKRYKNQNYLFTHGHHLNGVHALSLQMVENIRRLAGGIVSPADMERMMTYTYEGIYRSSLIGEIVELEERLWEASTVFEKVKTGILKTFKFTPVELQYDAITRFIKDRGPGRVDCFVYGDTHRADIYGRDKGPLAVNVGCFTGENKKGLIPNPGEIPDTYMLLGEDGVSLRQLGNSEPLFGDVPTPFSA